MPGFNREGPMGQGPATGRGRGACSSDTPGTGRRFMGAGRGYGESMNMGYGRGFGHRGGMRQRCRASMIATPYNERKAADEMEMLRTEADSLKKTLSHIRQRISELDQDPSTQDSE